LKPLVKLSAFTSCTQLVVLCAEKAEPVTINRDVGFAGPDQPCGLLSALSLWQQPSYMGSRPLAWWLLAQGVFALRWRSSVPYAGRADMLHRCSSKPLQILENISGEAGVAGKGRQVQCPSRPW